MAERLEALLQKMKEQEKVDTTTGQMEGEKKDKAKEGVTKRVDHVKRDGSCSLEDDSSM